MVNNMTYTSTLDDTRTPGIYTPTSGRAPVPPWEKPKIIAMTSIFGGRVVSVKNIMEPVIRRANNETFYR